MTGEHRMGENIIRKRMGDHTIGGVLGMAGGIMRLADSDITRYKGSHVTRAETTANCWPDGRYGMAGIEL